MLVIKGYDVVFLGEGPPPLEHCLGAHGEVRLPRLVLQFDDELPHCLEGGGGPPVVRHPRDLAAELQHLLLLLSSQADLVQHLHPAGLAQDVVVQSPLGYPVLDTGLGEPQLLFDDAVDGLVHLCLGPGRILDVRERPTLFLFIRLVVVETVLVVVWGVVVGVRGVDVVLVQPQVLCPVQAEVLWLVRV